MTKAELNRIMSKDCRKTKDLTAWLYFGIGFMACLDLLLVYLLMRGV